MTCMEVAGMKRVLFKILLPALLIALWLDAAYYPSLKDGQLDYFTYWIIAGLPFGIKAMGGIFYPVGFDLQGGVAVLAMNVVLGGLLGGFVLIFRILGIIKEIIEFVVFDIICRDLPVIDLDEEERRWSQ